MTDLHIGQWVRRERVLANPSSSSQPYRAGGAGGASDPGNREGDTPVGTVPTSVALTKGHLVESVIDGDAITRCGRRMRHLTRPRLVVHMGSVSRDGRPLDWDLCRGCA